MKNILVTLIPADGDACCRIFDIEKPAPTTEERSLIDAIYDAIAGRDTPWAYGTAPNEVWGIEDFMRIPFTGTIEDEVIIYVE